MFDISITNSKMIFSLLIVVFLTVFTYLCYRRVIKEDLEQASENDNEFDKILSDAGYAYDPTQDIFYSRMDAWQRNFGYCSLYDEAAETTGMILDSEQVRFNYGGKRWLIQFWKGQYCLSTGCEIGVYYTSEEDLIIPNLFEGTFYSCVEDEDRLDMAYALTKNSSVLFERSEIHWWLTGFRPGEFSEPWELTMQIRIALIDLQMCSNFVSALMEMGYESHEIYVNGSTVEFLFGKPHVPQPFTRNEAADEIIQRYNKFICKQYQEVTAGYSSWDERIRAIQENEPILNEAITNIGKTRLVIKVYEKLKGYLNQSNQVGRD